jgi:ribosomal protein L37AE/L43A
MEEHFNPSSGKTVTCAVCGEETALEETYEKIISWMCVNCGYTSNTLYKKNSTTIRKVFSTSPKFINDVKVFDTKRFVYWIPTVINMPTRGLIFPEGSKAQIIWTYIPMVDIPEKEQKNYPIENQIGKFYTQKLDPNQSKKFTRFYDALKEMGAIIRVDKLENPITM